MYLARGASVEPTCSAAILPLSPRSWLSPAAVFPLHSCSLSLQRFTLPQSSHESYKYKVLPSFLMKLFLPSEMKPCKVLTTFFTSAMSHTFWIGKRFFRILWIGNFLYISGSSGGSLVATPDCKPAVPGLNPAISLQWTANPWTGCHLGWYSIVSCPLRRGE